MAAQPSPAASICKELDFALLCLWSGIGSSNLYGLSEVSWEQILVGRSLVELDAIRQRHQLLTHPTEEQREGLLTQLRDVANLECATTTKGPYSSTSMDFVQVRSVMAQYHLNPQKSEQFTDTVAAALRLYAPPPCGVFASFDSGDGEGVFLYVYSLLMLDTWRKYEPALLAHVEEWLQACAPREAKADNCRKKVRWLLEAIFVCALLESKTPAVSCSKIAAVPVDLGAVTDSGWPLLLSKLLRGSSGVVRKRPRADDPQDLQQWRSVVAQCFAEGVHAFRFGPTRATTESGANGHTPCTQYPSVLVHDTLLHSLLPGVLTQTAYEWIWDVWAEKLNLAATALTPHILFLPVPVHPEQTVRDLCDQLVRNTFVERLVASMPKKLWIAIGRSAESFRNPSAEHVSFARAVREKGKCFVGEKQWEKILELADTLRSKPLTTAEIDAHLRPLLAPLIALTEAEANERRRNADKALLSASTLICAVAVATNYGSVPSFTQRLLTLVAPLIQGFLRAIPRSSPAGQMNSTASGTGSSAGIAALEELKCSVWCTSFLALLVFHQAPSSSEVAARQTFATIENITSFFLRILDLSLLAAWTVERSVTAGALQVAASAFGGASVTTTSGRAPNQMVPTQLFGTVTVRDVELFAKHIFCPSCGGGGESSILEQYRARHFLRTVTQILFVRTQEAISSTQSNSRILDDSSRVLLKMSWESWVGTAEHRGGGSGLNLLQWFSGESSLKESTETQRRYGSLVLLSPTES